MTLDFIKEYKTSSGEIVIRLGEQRECWAFSIKNLGKNELLGNGHYRIMSGEAIIDWMHIFKGNESLLLPRKVAQCILTFHKVEKVVGLRCKKKRMATIAKRRQSKRRPKVYR